MSSSSDDLAYPGKKLGVEEEYIGTEGTYYDEEGNIRASVIGITRYNNSERTVSVQQFKRLIYPRQGANVLGIVTSVHKDLVVVEVYAEVKLQPRFSLIGEYQGSFTAGIPLSQISEDYVKEIHDCFRIGDIIVAKVISKGVPLTLSTRGPIYGVLYAQCSVCGELLTPINQKTMKCSRCGHVEKRKVSTLAIPKPPPIRLKKFLLRTFS